MELFIRLLIAHILTDFFLQPNAWVQDKKAKKLRSPYLYVHVILTASVAYLLTWDYSLWQIPAIILVTHWLIDAWKVRFGKESPAYFITDQILHIAVITGCALIYGHFPDTESVLPTLSVEILAITLGYLVVTLPIGMIIGMFTRTWREELAVSQNNDSLEKAGIWIGILERVLVLTFVLLNQYQAIGFLIAAKSILRFSDRHETNPRKQTEYVLIGTLMSFGMALFTGLIVKAMF